MRHKHCQFHMIYMNLEYEVQANAEGMILVVEEGQKQIKARDKALEKPEALTWAESGGVTEAARVQGESVIKPAK